MKLSQRGSMQLGIEAIIILVMAVVVLGLGIFFVKDFFTGAGDVLILPETELSCNPSLSDPITVESSLKMESNQAKKVKLCLYSTVDYLPTSSPAKEVGFRIKPGTGPTASGECIDSQGAKAAVTMTSLTQGVKGGSTGRYQVLINKVQTAGTYICTLEAVACNLGTPLSTPIASGSPCTLVASEQITLEVS